LLTATRKRQDDEPSRYERVFMVAGRMALVVPVVAVLLFLVLPSGSCDDGPCRDSYDFIALAIALAVEVVVVAVMVLALIAWLMEGRRGD
jgi:fumarate reductase subunit D